MIEIGRSLPTLAGSGPITLSTGYNDSGLGFVLPLVVLTPPIVFSSPLLVAGVNSFMLIATLDAAVAGTMGLIMDPVRPDNTAWGTSTNAASASTAAGGNIVFTFASRGRDQTTDPQGLVSSIMVIGFSKVPPGATITAIRLFVMTRP